MADKDLVAELIDESFRYQTKQAFEPTKRKLPSRLAECLKLCRKEGLKIEHAKNGVSSAQVARLEKTIGWRLPDEYKTFLRRFGYIDTTNVTAFGISPRNLDCDVLAERARIVKELPELNLTPEASQALRNLLPLVQVGPNAILSGRGLFVDDRGRYHETDKDSLQLLGESPRPVQSGFGFERFLIEIIEEWAR
jgi:hypothetical protein